MLVVVSPAKNLDFQSPALIDDFSQPQLLKEAKMLISRCKKLSPADIASLMSLSDKLAGLNADRYAAWTVPFSPANAKQAILAFNGDVYVGLDANSFSAGDFAFAQQQLRILSGLYGVLRPLDLMQAYRLEMGTRLDTKQGDNLYQFWGDTITRTLNQTLQDQGGEVLINLASNEYFKSVKTKLLKATIVTPEFKDEKGGQYKVISFFAKKARGMMARYIIQHRLKDPEQLKHFNLGGYQYSEALSTTNKLVFTRAERSVA